MNQSIETIQRTGYILKTLSRFGFNELINKLALNKTFQTQVKDQFDGKTNESIYVRIRKVLEALGPTYIKLGQAFANREDLFPKELCIELQRLQDNVTPFELNVYQYIEKELNTQADQFFQDIQELPIATASIGQVYKATLLNGDKVVLKIKRPGIQKTIQQDLQIIKTIAFQLEKNIAFFKKINFLIAIESFERSLTQELSFLNEKNNLIQFARNFKNEKQVTAPRVYEDLSTNNLLVMEHIYGVRLTDLNDIKSWGLDPVVISDLGIGSYLKQILKDGFFHADPHAGNILVQKNGILTFIDMGAMGMILPNDKLLLEEFIFHFIQKNAQLLLQVLKKMAVKIEIKDERRVEEEVYAIFNLIDNNNLEKLDTLLILEKFKNLVQENNVVMPDYLYLLVRGVMLIEGVGRKINPQLNIMEHIKPYAFTIIQEKINPKFIIKQLSHLFFDFKNMATSIPKQINNTLEQLEHGNYTFNHKIVNLEKHSKNQLRGFKIIGLSIFLSVLLIMIISLFIYIDLHPSTTIKFLPYSLLSLFVLMLFFAIRLNLKK